MAEIFIYLGILLITAFMVAYVIRAFNQPIIVGYIIAGIIIGPFILKSAFEGEPQKTINLFSELGIAFLLFIVGLHLNPKVFKEIGGRSLLIGMGEMIVVSGIAFAVPYYFLGFTLVEGIFIALGISFSSTIIAMKMISDKGELETLYGKLSIGVLFVQDLLVIITLVLVSSLSKGSVGLAPLITKTVLGGFAMILLLGIVCFFALPKIMKSIAKSQELLFLFAIAWCFVIAALFSSVGFTIEIGALIAGIGLSMSPYSTEISAKIRPLRDFFLIIFFIILGLKIPLEHIGSIAIDALILSLIAIVVKPVVLMTLSAFLGYTKRTNFKLGSSLSQISEFSLLLAMMGVSLDLIGSRVLSTITLTALITITYSSYAITYSNLLYRKLYWVVYVFEGKEAKKEKNPKRKYETILFGYNRIGFSVLKALKKIDEKYLVVDFNPDTISKLKEHKVPYLYGDTYDPELLQELDLDKAKLIVSTVPDFETNRLLLETVRATNKKAVVITRAHQIDDALELYKKGSDYVLTPHFLGGDYLSEIIKESGTKQDKYKKERRHHIKMLEERLKKGHKHPPIEKG